MLYVLPSTGFTLVANVGTPDLTTVGVTIIKASDGSEVTARSQTGVVETPEGSGIYSVTRASAPATEATYIGVFDIDGAAPFVAVEFVVADEIPYLADLPEGLLTRIKERTETDIDDDELVRMAVEVRGEIELRYGASGEQEEIFYGRSRSMATSHIIDTGETVTVEVDDTELEATQFEVIHRGRTIVLLGDDYGGERVVVTYTPLIDTDQRDEATVKLVSLDLEYRGGTRYDRIGDVSNGYAVWAEERNMILRELAPRKGLMMF